MEIKKPIRLVDSDKWIGRGDPFVMFEGDYFYNADDSKVPIRNEFLDAVYFDALEDGEVITREDVAEEIVEEFCRDNSTIDRYRNGVLRVCAYRQISGAKYEGVYQYYKYWDDGTAKFLGERKIKKERSPASEKKPSLRKSEGTASN